MMSGKVLIILAGVFGGMARFLDEVLKNKRNFVAWQFVAFVTVSAFFGQIGAEVMILSGREDWAYVAAGIIGFMGTQAFDLFLDILKERLK